MKKYLAIITILILPLTTFAVNVRDGANGNVIGTQDSGAAGTVIDGGQQAGGYYWWNVDFQDSTTDGWVAENFLGLAVLGCTDQTATNYNANADVDDGSCNYPTTPGSGQISGINGPVGPNNSENVVPGANPYGGTDYFLSCTNGNDSNNGTSINTPWASLDKLNTLAFGMQAGTRILFQRGCTFRGGAPYSWLGPEDVSFLIGSSGSASAPIEVNAYGEGEAPILSGAILASNWTQDTGGVWKTNIGANIALVRALYVNNQLKTWAREPDNGWFRTDVGSNSMNITDSQLSGLGNLVGGYVFRRTHSWAYHETPITSQNGNNIVLGPDHNGSTNTYGPYKAPGESGYTQMPQDGWGYIVEGKRQFIDQPGEWHYDKTTGDLYYYPEGGANPNTQTIEVATNKFGIRTTNGKKHINIKNLKLEKYGDAPLRISDAQNVQILNNEVAFSRNAIVNYSSSSNPNEGNTIKNNYIHDIFADGIDNNGGEGHIVENNILQDISMKAEYGADASGWRYFALDGRTAVTRYNKLKNIGYIGIGTSGNSLVEKNLVEDSMLVLNDGAGITWDYADGLVVRNNIVKNVVGNFEAMPSQFVHYYSLGKGYYFGDKSIKNTTIENNIAINTANVGMHVDHTLNSVNNIVRNNVLYDAGVRGFSFSDYSNYITCPDGSPPGCTYVPQYNDIVYGNEVYSFEPTHESLWFIRVYDDGGNPPQGTAFGDFYDNYFYHPYRQNDNIFMDYTFFEGQNQKTIAQFQSYFNQPPAGQAPNRYTGYTLTNPDLEAEIYYNDTLAPKVVNVGNGGCDKDRNPLVGNKTIQPFTSLVVEFGNC